MSFFNKMLLIIVSSFVLSTSASAVTTEYFIQEGFVEAGIFLFSCGLVLVIIPRLTRLGIIFTLFGNSLIILRMLYFKPIEEFVNRNQFDQWLQNLSEDDLRLYMGIILILFMVFVGFLFKSINILWRNFWRLFGFYKNEEELKVSKEKKQRKIEKSYLKKLKLGSSEQSSLTNLNEKEITLDLSKMSSVIETGDKNS